MELVNCKKCGKLTINIFGQYCPDCHLEREKLISIIKDFLITNRGAGISDIVDNIKISPKVVFDLIQEGRINISKIS